MAYHPKNQNAHTMTITGTDEQYLKNQAAIKLLKAWRAEDAQEQRETWRTVKTALEEDRLSVIVATENVGYLARFVPAYLLMNLTG